MRDNHYNPFRKKLNLAIAAGLALVLSACGTTSAEQPGSTAEQSGNTAKADDKVIAINLPGATKNSILQAALETATARAAEEGYEVIVDDPQTDLNKQISTLTTWIQQDVDVIITQPIAPESVEEIAKDAQEAGVGWITYGVQMENQNGFVGFDHMQQTEALVQILADWLKQNPNVEPKIALLTLQSIEWARQREEGFDVALEKLLPNATVVARQDALSQTEGLKAMSTVLQANPDVNVVLAISDTASEGAYQAFLNEGHDPKDPDLFVGGMDGTAGAFELLANNTFYRGSAAIDANALGETLVDAALAAANGEDEVDKVIPAADVTSEDPRIPELIAAFEE